MNIMTITILRTAAALCLAAGMAGCSKPKPTYPHAGLKVTHGGDSIFNCGFFYRTTEGKMERHPSEMGASDGAHEFKVFWSLRPDATGDIYKLKMIVDGVTTEHEVTYSGKPVVVMEKPMRVVVEDMKP